MAISHIAIISGVTITQNELVTILKHYLYCNRSELLFDLNSRGLLTNTDDGSNLSLWHDAKELIPKAEALITEVVDHAYSRYDADKPLTVNRKYTYNVVFELLVKFLLRMLTTEDYELLISTNKAYNYNSFDDFCGWSIVIGKVIKAIDNTPNWCDNQGYNTATLQKLSQGNADKLLALLESVFGLDQAKFMMSLDNNYGIYQLVVRDDLLLLSS